MRTILLLSFTLAAVLPAQSWNENGEAGDLPAAANVTLGDGPLTTITGALGANDVDLYLIKVDDPATFRCSSVGGASFDTQLWIFDLQGYGIAFKDDDNPVLQSTLTGQFVTGDHHVLIGVSQYDRDPLDGAGNELWLDSPYTIERQPDGPGAANALAQWSGGTGGGSYTLKLAGATYAGLPQSQGPEHAWAWVNPAPFVAPTTFVPNLNFQHTPTGEIVRVNHLAVGRFELEFPPTLSMFESMVEASSYGGSHATVIEDWFLANDKLRVYIDTFDVNGSLADRAFTVRFRDQGQPTERSAFVWANSPFNPAYTADVNFSWNGNRPDPTITRLGVGHYRVRFPGLGASFAGGTFGVTPWSGFNIQLPKRAKIDSWGIPVGSTDLDVVVRSFDMAGNQADTAFVLCYDEQPGTTLPQFGSGAFVWANQPAAAIQTGAAGFTASNGTLGSGLIQITRLATGRYNAFLPSVAPYDSSVATVVARDNSNKFATLVNWGPSGTGTSVEVRTYNANGTPADSEFILRYDTNRPAGDLATNNVIGGGCGGLSLTPNSRPVLGSSWNLSLTTVPQGALVGLMALGFSNPNFPLGLIGAPDCFAYQDLAHLVTAPLPPASPSYALQLPPNPNLIGAVVYVQGGVLIQGVNPLNLLTSNGVRGVVGDV